MGPKSGELYHVYEFPSLGTKICKLLIGHNPLPLNLCGCKSQDSAGGIGIILRVVPLSKPVFSDRLFTRIPLLICPAETWDLQNVTPVFKILLHFYAQKCNIFLEIFVTFR